MSDIIIKTKDICKNYSIGSNEIQVLKNINIQIEKGEFVSIMGPSGSGKSTLLYILGGLENSTSGEVTINEINMSKLTDEAQSKMRRQNIGFIFQAYNLIPNLTVEENILLPLQLDKKRTKEIRPLLDEILDIVDLKEHRKHTPSELSGGQQQRVSIATSSSLIFANESFQRVCEYMFYQADTRHAGIAEKKGVFLRELADGGTIIMPLDTLTSLGDYSPNLVYIKDKNKDNLVSGLTDLRESLPNVKAELTVDQVLIKAETTTYVMPFRISAFAVIFMSIFISYSGFSMIAEDRIFGVGIIRNLGITKKKMNLLLILESMFIGVVGGSFGILLGLGIGKLIQTLYFNNPDSFGSDVPMIFGIREIMYCSCSNNYSYFSNSANNQKL